MEKRQSLVNKLINFIVILVVSVLVMAGLSTYANQTSIYIDENEGRIQGIIAYLSKLMETDGSEFEAYQELMLEVGQDIRIPIDFNGDYRPAKYAFYEKFNDEYPGKIPGSDVDYTDMTHELKVAYVTYKHEFWLHVFEEARDSFGINYTYYIVPTGNDLEVCYMVDAVREPFEVNGKKYIHLNIAVDQPMENHEHMWKAWNTGEFVPGYDVTNNEFGVNCCYFHPLIINGKKMGVVGADVSIESVNNSIVDNTIKHVISIGLIVIVICSILSYLIGKKYIKRLIMLKEDITEFSNTKDPKISYKIMKDIKGNDEINELAKQTSIMISEIGTFMQTLMDKNKELTKAQEQIRMANELANRDALTGIRNKAAYDVEVRKIEEKIVKEGFRKFGVAMVDLNYLKFINDSYGHDKGNIAIKKICMLVCRTFTHSPVFRIGGDEFVVIIENSDFEEAEILVNNLKAQLKELSKCDALEPWERISAAIGWTIYDQRKDSGVQSVFKRADDLMYKEKKAMKAERK